MEVIGSGLRLFQLQQLLKIQTRVSICTDSKDIDKLSEMVREKEKKLYTKLFSIRNLENSVAAMTAGHSSSTQKVLGCGRVIVDYVVPQTTPEDAIIYLKENDKIKLDNLFKMLRTCPDVLATVLLKRIDASNNYSMAHEADLAHSIVISVFDNCMTRRGEHQLMRLIRKIVEVEYKMYSETNSAIGNDGTQGHRCFAITEHYSYLLLSSHLSMTYSSSYIRILSDIITDIVSDRFLSFESNPDTQNIINKLSFSGLVNPQPNSLLRRSINDTLDSAASEFIIRVIDQIDNIPYSLRWLAKYIIILSKQYDNNNNNNNDNLLNQDLTENDKINIYYTIFGNLLIPLTIRPDHHIGIQISPNVRHNFVLLSSRITYFMTNPSKIPDTLADTLVPMIQSFYQNVINVLDFDDYFSVPRFQTDHNLPISTVDIAKITNAILNTKLIMYEQEQHQQELNQQEHKQHGVTEYTNELNECFEIAEYILPLLPIGQGIRYLKVNLSSSPPRSPSPKRSCPTDLVELTKKQLIQCLTIFDELYATVTNNIPNLLIYQLNRNTDTKLPIIVKETIVFLNQLPIEYQNDDFKLLLDEMFQDYQRLEDNLRSMKDDLQARLSNLTDQLTNVKSQTKILVDTLVCHKLKRLSNNQEFKTVQDLLIHFLREATQSKSLCDCNPISYPGVTCSLCQGISKLVANILEKPTSKIESNWEESHSSLTKVLNALNRTIFSQIYNQIFMISKYDVSYSTKLNRVKHKLNATSFSISTEIYKHLIPWDSAQNEIRKINLCRSPGDKMECIINTWNFIINSMKNLKREFAPDEYIPIMSYILLEAKPDTLLSNIQFIKLYGNNIKEKHSMWLEYFIGAVVYQIQVIDAHLLQNSLRDISLGGSTSSQAAGSSSVVVTTQRA